MRSVQWHFLDDTGCLRIVVPNGGERPTEILMRGDAPAMLSGTLCMLAIVDHKGREEMYFCDFRKLRVLARGRSLEPLRSGDNTISGAIAFGFRKGSGKDSLWLGDRAWQDTKMMFGALPASTLPTSLPLISIDGKRSPALTLRTAVASIAILVLVSVALVFGITSYRLRENPAPPVSGNHSGGRNELIAPKGAEPGGTMAGPADSRSEIPADESRALQKKRKVKRDVRNDPEAERGVPVLNVPCTRDMVDRGIPCG